MKSNIVPFKRKAAPIQTQQIDYQELLHSVFFMTSVITEIFPNFVSENHSERDFVLSYCDKHLSVIRNFISQ